MNDEIREKLSAYIDGALSDVERAALEIELSKSTELRLGLESLRAASAAVKGLPKAKLPAGFMARLEARRHRVEPAERAYFVLPPAYRPIAFALSTAIVALVVWDKTHSPSDMVVPRPGWDGGKVAVKSAADAPASIDVSGRLAAAQGESASVDLNSPSDKLGTASTFGKHLSAPGAPIGVPEETNGAGLAPVPTASPAPERPRLSENDDGPFLARNEEERSLINERLYKKFEDEKKKMGIAKIIDKADSEEGPSSPGQEVTTLQASPEAARLDGGRGSISAASGVRAQRRATPIVRALSLKSSEALRAAWAAAGLPGKPPTVDFSKRMALFLAGPEGCGIVRVQNRARSILVIYKNAGVDDAAARVKSIPSSEKPIVLRLSK